MRLIYCLAGDTRDSHVLRTSKPGVWPERIRGVREFIEDFPCLCLGSDYERRQRARAAYASAHKVTKNPQALPDDLNTAVQEVVECGDKLRTEAIMALAAHPNTPSDSLLHLIHNHYTAAAHGLARNPILPLLTLERPDFLEKFQQRFSHRLLRDPGLPVPITQLFTSHPNPLVAWEAANSVPLAGEVDHRTDWRAEVEAAAQRLIRIAPTPDPDSSATEHNYLLVALAKLGALPWEKLRTVNLYGESVIRRRAEALQAIKRRTPEMPFTFHRHYHKNWAGKPLWYYFSGSSSEPGESTQEYFDELALYLDTPAWVLAGLCDPVRSLWILEHPNTDDMVRSAVRKYVLWQYFVHQRESSGLPYFALTRFPAAFWHEIVPEPADDGMSKDPYNPQWICCDEAFTALERCAAISFLPRSPRSQPHRRLAHRLLKDNNRYVRAAAREQFVFQSGSR